MGVGYRPAILDGVESGWRRLVVHGMVLVKAGEPEEPRGRCRSVYFPTPSVVDDCPPPGGASRDVGGARWRG